MKLEKIVAGLKDGSITILKNGHSTNDVIDRITCKYERMAKRIAGYKEKIKKGEKKDGSVSCENMISFYEMMLEVNVGNYIDDIEIQCFSCDARLYPILIDEKTIGYMDSDEYWKLVDLKKERSEHSVKREELTECSASQLTKDKKLTANINVPSGTLIFQNMFKADKMYQQDDEPYKPSICSVLGRDLLMQELASRDVGYGQMGNMSVAIYSNEKDEIIVGSSYAEESYEDNKHFYTEHPEEITDKWLKEEKAYKVFEKIIKDGKFENKGEISLSVWRWMCADIETMKKYGEEPTTDPYKDSVEVKVNPGTYEINHFYDFPQNGDYIYSTLKLTKL